MRPVAKAGLIAVGYAAAVVIALVAVRINAGLIGGPDRQASAGMYAFGDAFVFLAVFGLAAIAPTGVALHALRQRPQFWVALSIAALAVAATSVAAAAVQLASRGAGPGLLAAWSAFATIRILAAPLCALWFLLACLFAPNRRARFSLLGAATIEIVMFTVVVSTWVYRPY